MPSLVLFIVGVNVNGETCVTGVGETRTLIVLCGQAMRSPLPWQQVSMQPMAPITGCGRESVLVHWVGHGNCSSVASKLSLLLSFFIVIVCVCVCVCLCVHVRVCACACMHVHACTFLVCYTKLLLMCTCDFDYGWHADRNWSRQRPTGGAPKEFGRARSFF